MESSPKKHQLKPKQQKARALKVKYIERFFKIKFTANSLLITKDLDF